MYTWTCTFYIANDLHLFAQTYFFYMLLQNLELLRAPLPAPYQDVRSADLTVQEIRLRHDIIKILGSESNTLDDIATRKKQLYDLCKQDTHFADICILPDSFHTIECMAKQRGDMELLSSVSAVPCPQIIKPSILDQWLHLGTISSWFTFTYICNVSSFTSLQST